jgi:CRISPR-associated endonuclease Csn1
VRGSLHQDSIYGAIKNPLNVEEIKYVIRKDLESLKPQILKILLMKW